VHLCAEANSTDLRAFSESLNEAGLSIRVLKLHSLDTAYVVEIASILIVGTVFGEGSLGNEVARLFVQVLLQVASDNNVHKR